MNFVFPAFFDRPTGVRFAQQETDEVIELLLRRHWITNVPWIFISLLLAIVPFLVIMFSSYIGLAFFAGMPVNVRIGILVGYYLLILAYIAEEFLSWYFNIYIVTDKHLLDVNFYNLLSREVVEAGLENVESASSKINGLIRSFFNFGDVKIQTAADKQQILFNDVPYPDLVSDRINDLKSTIEKSLEAGV